MTLNLSRSEIKSEVEKAVRGHGVDWGRAKDAGVMAVWLAVHNQPFLGSLLRALDEAQDTIPVDNDMKCGPTDGVLLSEYVLATGQAWSGAVFGARYLMAGMGLVTQEQQSSLVLYDHDGVICTADKGKVYIREALTFSYAELRLCSGPLDAAQEHLEMLDISSEVAHSVSQTCWNRLNALAWKVYVPETEEKRRAGAGAGDIDNN